MSVLCVFYSNDKRQKPGQSGQTGTDKSTKNQKKFRRMFVLCVVEEYVT